MSFPTPQELLLRAADTENSFGRNVSHLTNGVPAVEG